MEMTREMEENGDLQASEEMNEAADMENEEEEDVVVPEGEDDYVIDEQEKKQIEEYKKELEEEIEDDDDEEEEEEEEEEDELKKQYQYVYLMVCCSLVVWQERVLHLRSGGSQSQKVSHSEWKQGGVQWKEQEEVQAPLHSFRSGHSQ